MKPLIRTRRVITRHHIPVTHALTNTIFLIIPVPLILDILHLHILVVLVARGAVLFARGDGSAGFFVAAAATSGVLFCGGGV